MTATPQAQAIARRKLAHIIEREGDCGGARREPWYLEQLIQEVAWELNFAQITQEAAGILEQDTQQSGVKERQLTSHNVNRQEKRPAYEYTPIVAQERHFCNRRT